MKDERLAFEKIMGILDEVLGKMGSMHALPLDFGTGVALYRTEIHTIQAIGKNPGVNVTQLAEHLGVTKGAVSQMVAKLVGKGLARKKHTQDDAREILLELTDLGWTGFHAHEQFHMEMFETVREYLGDEFESKSEMFLTVMTDLSRILARFEERGLGR
ncbi:MAG: MarR family transcriptional regulator [Candidatus Eisenbacteria sp.]|nr:MarR family transcriptional regulator [Candidatus Eisenbacteria bacterium]